MKGKDGNGMDGWVLVALLIAIILLAFVFVYLVGKWREDSASAYVKRITAEQQYDAAIIREAKVLIVGKMAFITRGVEGTRIIYDERPIDDTGTPISGTTIDGKKITQHQLASRLVDDSITENGVSGTQLLSSRQWEKMGNDPELHHSALEYLYKIGLIEIKNGGKKQGTYVKDEETLQSLMLKLSVYALPLATGQKLPLPQDVSRAGDKA